ncbi:MAG: hypothetical protein VX324_09015 [Pseudomonadota bacterium]|jgi:hypothetical protein|uniref:hypothetical protein n=1 Tax=Marinobacter sp. TaxID=50741 RepID=UPI002E87B6F5|nr:hypothetical protein [Pseudomonadota bacterium]
MDPGLEASDGARGELQRTTISLCDLPGDGQAVFGTVGQFPALAVFIQFRPVCQLSLVFHKQKARMGILAG